MDFVKSRSPLGAVLLHPVALGALAVLLLNDHVLKARFPGLVTGKLSDFAGMVVAPLVLVAALDAALPGFLVVQRRYRAASAWVSAGLVASVFAATKTWSGATLAYEAAFHLIWRGHVTLVRDPTDLVAIPMGALAAVIASRRLTLMTPERACA